MKLWLKGTIWLWVLLLMGCGATYQSEPTGEPRIVGHSNPYFEQGNIYVKKKAVSRGNRAISAGVAVGSGCCNYPRSTRLGVLQRGEAGRSNCRR